MTTAADKSQTTRDPVRRWTLIVLGLIVVLFLYSIIADRLTSEALAAVEQAKLDLLHTTVWAPAAASSPTSNSPKGNSLPWARRP